MSLRKRRMREMREKLKGRIRSQYNRPWNKSLGFCTNDEESKQWQTASQ